MNVRETVRDGRMGLAAEGKLDSVSSPKFEEDALEQLNGITSLIID